MNKNVPFTPEFGKMLLLSLKTFYGGSTDFSTFS